MDTEISLWQSSPPGRHIYLLSDTAIVALGSLAVHGSSGHVLQCGSDAQCPIEVTEDQARSGPDTGWVNPSMR